MTEERPLWLHGDGVRAMFEAESMSDGSAIMDLLTLWGSLGCEPLVDDWKWIAGKLNVPPLHESRHMTSARWQHLRPKLDRYFVKLSDGRITPSPEIVVANDPYQETS